MSASVRVAVAQTRPGVDVEANLDGIARDVATASVGGARVVVFPEYATYFRPDLVDVHARAAVHAHAEPLTGPTVQKLGEIARAAAVTLIVGTLESSAAGLHNTLIALSPNGELVAQYRKIHLFDAFGVRESDAIAAGDPAQAVVVDVDGFRFGLHTCYDLRFPELARRLVDAGAEALVVPAQWLPGEGKVHQWRTLVTARAIENTSYVLAAGQAGPHGSGSSLVIDPAGVELAACDADDLGVIVATIERARIDEVRARVPSLAARRLRVAAPHSAEGSG